MITIRENDHLQKALCMRVHDSIIELIMQKKNKVMMKDAYWGFYDRSNEQKHSPLLRTSMICTKASSEK